MFKLLFDLQVVYGRDIVERHVAGVFSAEIARQPPVRMRLVHDNQLIILLNGHVVFGGALVVEQSYIVGLVHHLTVHEHSIRVRIRIYSTTRRICSNIRIGVVAGEAAILRVYAIRVLQIGETRVWLQCGQYDIITVVCIVIRV